MLFKTVKNKHIDFGAFKRAREKRHLTFRDVEEYTGINKDRVMHMEDSDKQVLGDAALKLFFFYELTEDDILLDNPPDKS